MDLKFSNTLEPHVLIVEPSRHFASLLRHILSVGGVRNVRHAFDSYGALEVIKNAPVDLAIVDSEVTGISALELTRVIRRASDSPNRALPIILLSDRPTRRLIADAMQMGVNFFVRKPVSADTLLKRIKWSLDPDTAHDESGPADGEAAGKNTPAMDEDVLPYNTAAADDDIMLDDAVTLDDDVTLDDTDDPLATLAI